MTTWEKLKSAIKTAYYEMKAIFITKDTDVLTTVSKDMGKATVDTVKRFTSNVADTLGLTGIIIFALIIIIVVLFILRKFKL